MTLVDSVYIQEYQFVFQCVYRMLTHTHSYTCDTHMHIQITTSHPCHPGLVKQRRKGGWRDEGGLQVIKIGCGLVSVSSAIPHLIREAYHSTAISHSFCPFSFLSSPPPLLSHTTFHHYLRPRFCSGLSCIQIMIFLL